MILLDTNVVSELMRATPDPKVERWLASQKQNQIFFSAISVAEIFYGIGVLPPGRRREDLRIAFQRILDQSFGGRVLPFDGPVAPHHAAIAIERRRQGLPIATVDCQIAAIARFHGAAIATRNEKDFRGVGLELLNPWRD